MLDNKEPLSFSVYKLHHSFTLTHVTTWTLITKQSMLWLSMLRLFIYALFLMDTKAKNHYSLYFQALNFFNGLTVFIAIDKTLR